MIIVSIVVLAYYPHSYSWLLGGPDEAWRTCIRELGWEPDDAYERWHRCRD